jgi:hypothetical protein
MPAANPGTDDQNGTDDDLSGPPSLRLLQISRANSDRRSGGVARITSIAADTVIWPDSRFILSTTVSHWPSHWPRLLAPVAPLPGSHPDSATDFGRSREVSLGMYGALLA